MESLIFSWRARSTQKPVINNAHAQTILGRGCYLWTGRRDRAAAKGSLQSDDGKRVYLAKASAGAGAGADANQGKTLKKDSGLTQEVTRHMMTGPRTSSHGMAVPAISTRFWQLEMKQGVQWDITLKCTFTLLFKYSDRQHHLKKVKL